MKKNVLIVTYYWPPSGGAGVQRFLKFAKYLPRFDVRPFVLTVANPTYPILDESLEKDIPASAKVFTSKTIEPFSIYAKLTGKAIEELTKPTIRLKSNNWKTKLSGWIRANLFLPDARVGWLLTARSNALSIVKEHNIDLIITTGPPHSTHFVGKYVKSHLGIPWFADFRDPWTGVYYNRLMPRIKLVNSIDRRLEKSILKAADEVIVISDSMVNVLEQLEDRTYHVIPNGFDPDDFKIDHLSHAEKNNKNDYLMIRFVGSVRDGAIPDGFLKALARQSPGKYKMEFIGNAHPSLQQWIDKLKLNDIVKLRSYVPHDEAVRAMCTADLLLLSISKTPGSELILTGKLFEYLGSGTPIIFLGATQGDAAKIIKESGQGVCFEHNQTDKIADFLALFSTSESPSFKQPPGNEEHPFSRVHLTKKLAELIIKY